MNYSDEIIKIDGRKLWEVIFWGIPLVLFLLQAFFTLNSTSQIRYEELAESVRNVFWLDNKTIYDGVSSNVGWYGTLLLLYKTFGFSLNNAKFFRLALQLVSLYCLTAVLKRYLGSKGAIVPLLAFGLSPTLLFFNTLQTSYGIDLQYFPICLWLLVSLDFKKHFSAILKQILLWSIAMVAWMSYPTFIFYLPVLGILYFWQIYHQLKGRWLADLGSSIISAASFLLPFALAMMYVKDKGLLWYDPVAKSGIFRGAGSFYPDPSTFLQNLGHTLGDLFIKADSYYFEVNSVDFSNLYPWATVLLVLSLSIFFIIKNRSLRAITTTSLTLLIFSLIVANLTSDPTGYPGIRRNTSVLASLYALFTISWYFVTSKRWMNLQLKNFFVIILLLLPVHHLLVYSGNFFHLADPSPRQYSHIFSLAGTPEKSLDLLVNSVKKDDLKLACKNQSGNLAYCRYVEAYAAVAGYCTWNNISCYKILGYDPKQKNFIPLTIKLWGNYYWEH